MLQWLKMMIETWLQRRMAALKALEKPQTDPHPPCPICGEEWDKGEIFCYLCGYQELDELLPLNPPPEKPADSHILDPDKILSDTSVAELNSALNVYAEKNQAEAIIFIMPDEMRKFIENPADGFKAETLDGFAYNLYNTWQIGKDTGRKGLLLVADEKTAKFALVSGMNGPEVSGKEFRNWIQNDIATFNLRLLKIVNSLNI